MNIYSSPLGDLTFEEIVKFSEQKVPEGVTLEYKSDFPKDLAKQFVAFSNTKGGLVIIGIREDENGLPVAAEGVKLEGKLDDRVHNIAGNVLPLPSYEVAITNAVKGHVFVLIRIFEGTAPPYATQQDQTPLLRTGNVTKPLTQANREELLELIGKRTHAADGIEAATAIAVANYQPDLVSAEAERLKLIAEAKESVYTHKLGPSEHAAIFSASVLPAYTDRHLFNYDDLRKPYELLGDHYHQSAFTYKSLPVPGGITGFTWNHHSGNFSGSQIYLTGQWYHAWDMLRSHDGKRYVSTVLMSEEVKRTLELSKHLYRRANYNGSLTLRFTLSGGLGALVVPPYSGGWGDDYGKLREPYYQWDYTTDTKTIDDTELRKSFHVKILKDMSWSLGVENNTDSVIKQHFDANHWYK